MKSFFKQNSLNFFKHTQWMFIGSKLLISPLDAMFALLAFILLKDLNATPLQLTLLVSSKPLVSLIAFYGNLVIKGQTSRLKPFLMASSLLGFLPCFFFPFAHNIWFFLIANALFMMSAKAMIPAWSEILKLNLPSEERGKVFSQGSIAYHLTKIVIPVLLSPWIDFYPHVWKWMFFGLASLQAFNIGLLYWIQIKRQCDDSETDPYLFTSLGSIVLGPWKNGWKLMKQRPDFRNFQVVFLFGGAGLILMHPVLPIFFKDILQLSYVQLTLATSFCMGVGYALSSQTWGRWIHRIPINLFNFYVTLFAAVYAVLVVASGYQVGLIYLAYILYGIMQAGSEMSWNLSGPLFAKDKDSTLFSGVNVAMVGLRGCIAPFLGELLFLTGGSTTAFLFGGGLCLLGSIYSFSLHWKERGEKGHIHSV